MEYHIKDHVVIADPDHAWFAVYKGRPQPIMPGEVPYLKVGKEDRRHDYQPLIGIDLIREPGNILASKFRIKELAMPTSPQLSQFDFGNGPFLFQGKMGLGVTDIRDGALVPALNLNEPGVTDYQVQISQPDLIVYANVPVIPPASSIQVNGNIVRFNRLQYEILLDLQSQSFVVADRLTSNHTQFPFLQGSIAIEGQDFVLNLAPASSVNLLETAGWDILKNFSIVNGALFFSYDAPEGNFISTWDLLLMDEIHLKIENRGVSVSVPSTNPLNFLKINYASELDD